MTVKFADLSAGIHILGNCHTRRQYRIVLRHRERHIVIRKLVEEALTYVVVCLMGPSLLGIDRKDRIEIRDIKYIVLNAIGEAEDLFIKDADVDALHIASLVAHAMKDPELALRVSQTILKQNENDDSALFELPSIYIALKQFDKAVEAFENSVKLHPENPTALNNYSWFLSTTAQDAYRDGKKALDLGLKAAQASNYEKAYILSTLAAAYAENGDFENALKYIQKALEINKDESIAQSIKNEMESYKQNKPIREDSNEWFK